MTSPPSIGAPTTRSSVAERAPQAGTAPSAHRNATAERRKVVLVTRWRRIRGYLAANEEAGNVQRRTDQPRGTIIRSAGERAQLRAVETAASAHTDEPWRAFVGGAIVSLDAHACDLALRSDDLRLAIRRVSDVGRARLPGPASRFRRVRIALPVAFLFRHRGASGVDIPRVGESRFVRDDRGSGAATAAIEIGRRAPRSARGIRRSARPIGRRGRAVYGAAASRRRRTDHEHTDDAKCPHPRKPKSPSTIRL